MSKSQKNLKILLENEIFIPKESKSSDLPCRNLWDLVIYDSKNNVTKLEELPTKGPFTAVAVANEPSDTKPEYLGCTVIISPIMEYSMEYPFGEDAIIWLRSNQAFYRVMSVSSSYASVWEPLKSLIDLSGHTVNTMLRSNPELLTPFMVKKIADLAKFSLKQTIEMITNGRNFILEQIRNQQIARLLKYQFFKDLANTKVWHQFRMSNEESIPIVAPFVKKIVPSKPTPEPSKKSSTEVVKQKKHDAASSAKQKPTVEPPPALLKTKRSSSESANRKPKRILDLSSSESDVFLTARAIKKPSGKLTARKSINVKEPVKAAPKKALAKRTNWSKSLISPNLIILDVPDERDFEYACPYCGLVLRKSSSLPRLLPRIQLHLSMHSLNSPVSDDFKGLGFSDRMTKFLKKVGDTKTMMLEPSAQSCLEWPKLDLSKPRLEIAVEPTIEPLLFSPIGSSSASAIPLTLEDIGEITVPLLPPARLDELPPIIRPVKSPQRTKAELKPTVPVSTVKPKPKVSQPAALKMSAYNVTKSVEHVPKTAPHKANHQPLLPKSTPKIIHSTFGIPKPVKPTDAKSFSNELRSPSKHYNQVTVPFSTRGSNPADTTVKAKLPEKPSITPPGIKASATILSKPIDLTIASPVNPILILNSPRAQPSKPLGLYDSDDDDVVVTTTLGGKEAARLDRLPDVRIDHCWKCGFRVTRRECHQCGALQ